MRFFSKKNCFRLALLLGLVLAVVLTDLCSFGRVCDEVRSQTLRLHIMANSDSTADQALKLKVRDAVVQRCGSLFDGMTDRADAVATAQRALPVLKKEAEQVLRSAGSDASVQVSVEERYFNTRTYGNFTLPAGQYQAICITLGSGNGKNWWCVLFPPLCIPAGEQDAEAEAELVYGQQGTAAIESRYEVRFAVVEWYEQLKSTLWEDSSQMP